MRFVVADEQEAAVRQRHEGICARIGMHGVPLPHLDTRLVPKRLVRGCQDDGRADRMHLAQLEARRTTWLRK